ncbi:hypothetical protein NEOLEDRAFT_1177982 [Neolentinus lepideus HHB14362 ss-1]|uniref:Uncharacterized protein n=1 Tax=Neolentinus lepideus HHB14362 ss-1 TaxID=1314782 RepID=A0A165SXP8_9AGAM|nr:hypothetical protein NEOLEDRAFT_1177982 [Neolentinus lepideus HHB14362 ss-1]
MNRLRKKLSSADVKTPTPTTNPPSLPKPTLLPLYARFATSAAQNTSPDTGRASRDRTSKVLSVSSPMPLTKPADERRQPGRKANNGAGEERARRLQRSQPREREKEALLRGRSLDVRGDRDRQEHGKTYPTPNSSHPPSISPTRPTATPRSQSQHHHHREKEVSRKPLPSPSASPPITPRASRASLFSKPKEPDSSRRHDAPAHSSRQDAPVYSSRHDAPSSRKERAPSTSRPTNVNTGHRSRLPTPPSPTRDQHSSVQPHSHSVHRARSSQSLAPSQPAVASNPQSQYNQNQSRSRSAVRSSSRAPPRGQPIPSPQISNFSQSMYPQSPSAPAVSPHSHSHPHVLPRSPSSSQLQYPQSPTLSMYPHSPSVLPRSHFPSLQPHSQVSLQPQPLASPQLQSLASPQLQVSHPPYSRTPYNNTSLHSPGSSAPTGSLSPDAATYREKTLPRDKEKDNDRHNLRHKSRQVFHQVPDSLPSTEEKPRRQDVGDDGPRRRTLSGDTVRTQDNRLQAPEISADGSALSVTPPEKVMCLPFLTSILAIAFLLPFSCKVAYFAF